MSAEAGRRWESAVTAWLVERGFDAFRLRGAEGYRDHGDIGGFARWALDCKDHAKMSLGSWVSQAREEAVAAEKPLSAVVVKKRGAPVADAYVVMDLATWVLLESYLDALSQEVLREVE